MIRCPLPRDRMLVIARDWAVSVGSQMQRDLSMSWAPPRQHALFTTTVDQKFGNNFPRETAVPHDGSCAQFTFPRTIMCKFINSLGGGGHEMVENGSNDFQRGDHQMTISGTAVFFNVSVTSPSRTSAIISNVPALS